MQTMTDSLTQIIQAIENDNGIHFTTQEVPLCLLKIYFIWGVKQFLFS